MVDIRGLSKSFEEKVAVADITLAVHRGEIFTLLGPNGAGKTTTIRMLMGMLRPSAGTATIAGHDCFGERERVMAHVGYVPDEPAFYEHLRGSELLDFVATMHGIDATEAHRRRDRWVERLDFVDALGDFAVSYSHGMKKKLALVAALLPEPDLLILDEPTNGLDPIATRTLHEIMKEQRQRGTAILFSTHLLDQAQRLCDRVAVIHKARLAAIGALDDLRAGSERDVSLEELFFAITGSDSEQAQEGGDDPLASPVSPSEVSDSTDRDPQDPNAPKGTS